MRPSLTVLFPESVSLLLLILIPQADQLPKIHCGNGKKQPRKLVTCATSQLALTAASQRFRTVCKKISKSYKLNYPKESLLVKHRPPWMSFITWLPLTRTLVLPWGYRFNIYRTSFLCKWLILPKAHRDAYLDNLKAGVKPDTLSALRNCPLNGYALFPDSIIRNAEDEITQFENTKRTPQPGSGCGGFAGGFNKQQQEQQQQGCFQPYTTNCKQSQDSARSGGQPGKDMPAWKSFGSRGRSRGCGRGGQPGRGTRPAKEHTPYK